MTVSELQTNIRILCFKGKKHFVPILIRLFIDEIFHTSKSNELAKRSCNLIIKKQFLKCFSVKKN